MKAAKTIISSLFVILVLFILFDACIYFVIFSPSYLMNRYGTYDTADQLSMSDADLKAVTNKLTDYVRGKDESIEITVSVRGETAEFFNEKDLSHMRDVRQIIITIRDLMILAFFAAFLCIYYLVSNKDLKCFRNGFFISLGFISALMIAVVVAANTGLDWLIVFCHNIFFNNSDWLLDPRYDNLIFLCPEELFIDAGIFVGIVLISFVIILGLLIFILPFVKKRIK